MKSCLLTILLTIGIAGAISAQSTVNKAELQKERKDIQDELKQIQAIHKKLKDQTKESLGHLAIMQRKTDLQQRYVAGLSKELHLIDEDINQSNVEIVRLIRQLDTLKSENGHATVSSVNRKTSFSALNFIFSPASNLPAIVNSLSYLKSYRSYREKQISTIKQTQQLISIRVQQKTGKKQLRSKTILDRNKQQAVLSEQRKEMNAIVVKLKSQERDLEREIAAKRQRDEALSQSMFAIANNDINNEADADIRNSNADHNLMLGLNFESSKGKLPWPVDGVVGLPFGQYKIEGTSLVGDSPGITIVTPEAGAPVRAVYDGVVSTVDRKGEITSVCVRHGKYYTMYSNLSAINVNKGDVVKTGQVIGKVGEAYETTGGELTFLLMAETKNVNPSYWLRPH